MKLSFAFVALVGARIMAPANPTQRATTYVDETMDQHLYEGGKVHAGEDKQSSKDNSQQVTGTAGQEEQFDHGNIHQFVDHDSVDDTLPMSSQDVLSKFLYKRSGSDNDPTVAKIRAGILDPTKFPTQMPTEHYMDRTDHRNYCVPWHVSSWEDEFSNRTLGCSKKCGGGKRKQSRVFSPPSDASIAQFSTQACDYGVTSTGADLNWPDQASLDHGIQYQTTDCNTERCPIDCQLDPVTDDNWVMGYDNDNKPIMKSEQSIGVNAEDGYINGVQTAGKACPTEEQRTRVRSWGQHCENVILKDCKKGVRKTGCVTKGAWSACDTSTNFMFRETVKKTCNHQTATGMIMTYKEARNCGATFPTTGNTQGADLGHFYSATGSSGSPGIPNLNYHGAVPNENSQPQSPLDYHGLNAGQGTAGSTPDHSTFDAYPNQQQAAYSQTRGQGASE
jgi:hypothetical protein